MKILLQAIKSLLRGIEARLTKLLADEINSFSDEIDSFSDEIDSFSDEIDSFSDEINSKLDVDNPVATGSFSLGRSGDSVVGSNSYAVGLRATASGDYSHAEGGNTTASGNYSHAEGGNTTASESFSHAEGYGTEASGIYSHAEGVGTTALGHAAHAEGGVATASGSYSHAEGSNTTASGSYSHAEGYRTEASRRSQHVEGEFNIPDIGGVDAESRGKYAHIVGNGEDTIHLSNAHTLDWDGNAWFQGGIKVGGTGWDDATDEVAYKSDLANLGGGGGAANLLDGSAEGSLRGAGTEKEGGAYNVGKNAAAFGSLSRASGTSSFAAGGGRAIGAYSHTEGNSTEASGDFAHAEGWSTVAKGNFSHAEGQATIANAYQHVQGIYNLEDASSKLVHIVGNGTSSNRSNAHTLDWDGNAWFAGMVEGTALILSSPNGTRFKITVDDNGALSAQEI